MTRRIALSTAALLALVAVVLFTRPLTSVASPNAGVFSATSPCGEFAKSFLRIPAGEKCDRIKWQISLYESGKYLLKREWGFHVDNRTYLPKDTTSIEGVWKTVKGGTNYPVVIQLDVGKPSSISFALVDQNILHVLDGDNKLAIGDSGASYTLSRDQKSSVIASGNHGSTAEQNPAPQAMFSGRSPCREVAEELNRSVPSDCFKLKWALTLRRDPETLAPTTYHLRGSLYWTDGGPEHPREGKWKITRGTKTNPNAVVYELEAFGKDGPILLLEADRNVLFFLNKHGNLLIGNDDFSYTLNRDERKS